jgi:glycosyltransferase involved in cell wall biosynthesis
VVKDWLNPSYEQGLVSVIVPCHNQERFLPACLESVTDQEYRPLEIIIVDDGSFDGTRRIINDFQTTQREGIVVKYIYQSKQGAQHARNEGLRISKGEFIQFLDSDDILCREKLVEQVMVFEDNSEIDVVYGDAQYLININPGIARKGQVISKGSSEDIIASLLAGAWVPSFSYLSRRSAIQRCGPWDETIKMLQDTEYFLRMAIQGCRFRYKAGINGYYRKYSLNATSEQSASIRGRTWQRILAQAEHWLKTQGEFNEQRALAIVECHRRIARQVYQTDMECFKNSLDDVVRLCPKFLPEKRRARLISAIIGFHNYERVAALISCIINKNKKDSIESYM